MLRTIGKTVGIAIAGMCLVSTLAIAQTSPPGQPLVCTKVDSSGYCIEAKAPDEKMITVRVGDVKVSEQISCVTTGSNTTCTKVTTVK
jgi:hypothetical protein